MIHCGLSLIDVPVPASEPSRPAAGPRICAVSYVNTSPLVWGLLHDHATPSKTRPTGFTLTFAPPAECADQVWSERADVGLIPVARLLPSQNETSGPLLSVADVGIACEGPVRSILLITKVPFRQIRTLASDENSRSSLNLARVILRDVYGVRPTVFAAPPLLEPMLESADAALLIGDPALYLEPSQLPYEWIDLGQAWYELTRLPMVFAVWAGRERWLQPEIAQLFADSYAYGKARVAEIVARESVTRRMEGGLVQDYLTRSIRYEIGERERAGMKSYLELVRDIMKETS